MGIIPEGSDLFWAEIALVVSNHNLQIQLFVLEVENVIAFLIPNMNVARRGEH